MKAADVVFAVVAKNIAHTTARLEATKSGTRILITPESPRTPCWPHRGRPTSPPEARRGRGGSKAHRRQGGAPHNAAGTDITMSIEGRRGRA